MLKRFIYENKLNIYKVSAHSYRLEVSYSLSRSEPEIIYQAKIFVHYVFLKNMFKISKNKNFLLFLLTNVHLNQISLNK